MQWTEEMGVELQRSEGARIAANGSLIGGLQVPVVLVNCDQGLENRAES